MLYRKRFWGYPRPDSGLSDAPFSRHNNLRLMVPDQPESEVGNALNFLMTTKKMKRKEFFIASSCGNTYHSNEKAGPLSITYCYTLTKTDTDSQAKSLSLSLSLSLSPPSSGFPIYPDEQCLVMCEIISSACLD